MNKLLLLIAFITASIGMKTHAWEFGVLDYYNRNSTLWTPQCDNRILSGETGFCKNWSNLYLNKTIDSSPFYVMSQGVLRSNGVDTMVCTDISERRVPGMLVDGKCNVEWGGNEHQNEDFFLLRNKSNYKWQDIENFSNSQILSKGVSTGVYDQGHPVFFCRARRSYNYVGATPPLSDLALGKYIIAHNACYFGYWGGRYIDRYGPKRQNHYEGIEVLIAE